MGVKVRERNGAWWLYIDHRGQRKAKRVGAGRPGRKAAERAAIEIQARLIRGDAGVFDPEPVRTKPKTFREVATDWLEKYPALHAIRPGTLTKLPLLHDQAPHPVLR